MVSSIGSSPPAPRPNTQEVVAQKQVEERQQQQNLEAARQAEAEQQRIRAEENRAAADERSQRTIDVIV